MSGHSKWSTIKHRKGAQDAKKGKIFTKLIKEITIAAKFGGGDPNINPRLRTAINAAKNENMPKNNIERAIKKGTGELEGSSYEENIYEGYGPGGVAILIESLTDNKNRTVAEIRNIFNKNGGTLGENGCVSWIFNKKGIINIEKNNLDVNEDFIIEVALEAKAEDILNKKNSFSIITKAKNIETVKQALKDKSIPYLNSSISVESQNTQKISEQDKEKLIKMIDFLEENDDIQTVYTNAEI